MKTTKVVNSVAPDKSRNLNNLFLWIWNQTFVFHPKYPSLSLVSYDCIAFLTAAYDCTVTLASSADRVPQFESGHSILVQRMLT